MLWLQSDLRRYLLTFRFFSIPFFLNKDPSADVYLALNDPDSFMLIQVLPSLEQRFNIKFNLYLVYDSLPGVTIKNTLHRKMALEDANFIATQYQLKTVNKYPSERASITGQQTWQLLPKTLASAQKIFDQTWFDEFDYHYHVSTPVINYQVKNLARLSSKGHYASATIFFGGEWFVGIDRLEYLEMSLINKGLTKQPTSCFYQHNQLTFVKNRQLNQTQTDLAIEVFISLDNPLAYIGLIQAKKLSEHYQIALKIRPLLTIAMTGKSVPECKQDQVFLDAKRVAKFHNIPFNTFSKTSEHSVANCYQLFAYAEQQNKAIEFMSAVFEALYVKNINLANSANINRLCQQIGLDYPLGFTYGIEHDWQQWSDINQTMLDELGLWDVPCFRFQNTLCSGLDRLNQIEQAIIAMNSI